jgi:hypothetical protein
MAGVNSASAEQKDEALNSWLRPAVVAAAALALAIVIGVRKFENPPSAPVVLAQRNPASLPSATSVTDPYPKQILSWSQSLPQPLETEMDSVLSDARAALKSLGDNFLPSGAFAKAD